MSTQSLGDIEKMVIIVKVFIISAEHIKLNVSNFKVSHTDLVLSRVKQTIASPISNLLLKFARYFYDGDASKNLLCLCGTIVSLYRQNRYNIPVEIWLQEDHPLVAPLAYVKPISNMYISPNALYVQDDEVVILSYLEFWDHNAIPAKNIRSHSYYAAKNASLLLPARQFEVVGCLDQGNRLHIVQLREIQPKFPLIK
ncbi:unnamed protein product, partial [Rotaria socialis]